MGYCALQKKKSADKMEEKGFEFSACVRAHQETAIYFGAPLFVSRKGLVDEQNMELLMNAIFTAIVACVFTRNN